MTFRRGTPCTTTGDAGRHVACGRKRLPCLAAAGARWRWGVLAAHRATRSWIAERVKTAAEGEARGLHGGKKVKGRARHVAIDSEGTLLAVHVCVANKADGAEAGTVMRQAAERHPTLESFTADTAYKRRAEHVAREQLGVELHVTANPRSRNLAAAASKRGGFKPVKFRWRVERTFAWFGQSRLLSKECEKTVASAQAWLWRAMTRLLVRRLAN